MRPIKIEICAFGPFAIKTEIDLSLLGDSGVYLITGDTGAGKTTIFDAISYALYGKPSGNNRDESMLRSDYADANTPTYVELTFECDGEVYKVKRNPKYLRLKKSGNGYTEEDKGVELTLPNGKIIDNLKDADRAIVEIVKLDRERFNKIAMIAQGDFQKLLFSDTKERMPLFRKIFGTHNYENLQNELKKRCDEARKEYENISSLIHQNITSAVCDENNQKREELEFHKNNLHTDPNIALQIIEEIYKADCLQAQVIDNEIEQANLKAGDLQKKIGTAELIAENLRKADELRKLIKDAEAKLTVAKSEFAVAQENSSKVVALSEAKVKIENSLEEYNEIERITNEVNGLNDSIKKNKAQLSNLEKQIDVYTQEKDLLTQKINAEAEIKAKNVTALSELDKIKNKTAKLNQLNEWLIKYKALKEFAVCAKAEFEKAMREYELIRNEYEAKNRAYLNEQAGILASNLTDNTPCPVCGSLSHPTPATLSENAPSKAEIDNLKNAVDRADKSRMESSEKAGKAKIDANTLSSRLIDEAKQIFSEFEVANLPNLIVSEREKSLLKVNEIKQTIRETETVLKDIAVSKTRLPEFEKMLTDSRILIEKLKTDISTQVGKAEEKNLQLNKLVESLEYNSLFKAKSAIQQLDSEILALNNAVTVANEKMTAINSQIISYKGKLEGLKDTKQTENLDELKLQNEKINSDLKTLRLSRENILKNITINSKVIEKISQLVVKRAKKDDEFAILNKLSQVANGGVSAKQKLSLEAYVQAIYFDRILSRANVRLLKMSSGRFEMQREQSTDNKQKQTGLDINVIDHYTGAVRKVKTLSGGESFMASLSLALGLSDEIQSASGGIKLDCMFIDEGFGSLDETSLSLAMQAFGGLSSGRLVGIISHVAELKEKISKQVVVKKSREGSTVEVVCN